MNGTPEETLNSLIKLKKGYGLQYILNSAYEILGNPVLLHDMEYNVIAYSGGVITDDPIWHEFVSNGTVGEDRLVFYEEQCFFETVADADKVTLLISPELKYNRIFGKIYTKHKIQIGAACMVACCNKFDECTFHLFSLLCDIITAELTGSAHFQLYGQTYMETLIEQLINNEIVNRNRYIAHIESLYTNMKSNLFLIVIRVNDMSCHELFYYKDIFWQIRPNYKYMIYDNKLVILMSTENKKFILKRDLGKLSDYILYRNMDVGVSGCFENLFELPSRYDEAVKALTV